MGLKFENIKKRFIELKSQVEVDNSLGLFDINKIVEDVYMHILNVVYGWDLKNANLIIENFPAVDLIDIHNKIVIQVTSTTDSTKLKNTTEKFKGLIEYSTYDLKIFYIKDKPNFQDATLEKYGIEKSNLLGIKDILEQVQSGADITERLYNLLEKIFENRKSIITHKNINTKDVVGVANADGSPIIQHIYNGNQPPPPKQEVQQLTSLPPINKDFIGRKDELKSIESNLNSNNVVCVVNGIGGVGKSELSYQYLHLNKHKYNHIAFLEFTAETSSLEDLLFIKFQDALLLDKDSTFDTIIRRLQKLPSRNLLVLDNIENSNDFERLKALNINFDLLVTTRIKLDVNNQLNLETLNQKDAKELFLSIYNTDENIDDILAYLDNHPLFINLTAKSLKEEYIELDELREDMKNHTISKIDATDDRTFKEHLQERFNQQFTKEPNNELKELLQILALFPSIEINFSILKQYINIPRLRPKLQKLVARGWLSKKEKSYKLHQIIKTFILSEYPVKYELVTVILIVVEKDISDIYVSILESLFAYFKAMEDEYIAKVLDVISSFYVESIQFRKALFFQQKSMEIREILYGEESEFTAKNYNQIGELYIYLKDEEKALAYLEKALEIRMERFGENHLDVADSYNSLAWFYRVKANIQKMALPLQDLIKNINLLQLNTSDKKLNLIDNQMGKLSKFANTMSDNSSETFNQLLPLYEKSLKFNQQALEIRKRLVNNDNLLIAKSYKSIARSYESMGDLKNALLFYEKVVDFKIDDESNTIYGNLSNIYSMLGNFDKALEFSKKDLGILQKKFGENHPQSIFAYLQQGIIYVMRGDMESFMQICIYSIVNFQTILPIFKEMKIFPSELISILENNLDSIKNSAPPEVALMLENNSNLTETINDLLLTEKPFLSDDWKERAYQLFMEKEYEQSISNFKKYLEENPNDANIYNSLGFVYKTINNYDNAKKYFQKSIEISPEYEMPYINMAIIEDGDIAIKYMKKAIEVSPESYKDVIENGGYYFYTEEDIAEVVGLVDEILGKND